MCSPTLAVMGIGTALSAASQVAGGMMQAQAYETRAEQFELQAFETRTRAMAESRARFEEFSELDAANNAAIAASGLSLGSFEHVQEANRRTALDDASLIEAQGRSEEARLRFAAEQEETAAQGSIFGAAIGALGTMAQGAASIYGQMPQNNGPAPSSAPRPAPRPGGSAGSTRSRGSLFTPF